MHRDRWRGRHVLAVVGVHEYLCLYRYIYVFSFNQFFIFSFYHFFIFHYIRNILKNLKEDEISKLRKNSNKSVDDENREKKLFSYFILDVFDEFLNLKNDDNEGRNKKDTCQNSDNNHDNDDSNDNTNINDDIKTSKNHKNQDKNDINMDKYDDIQKNECMQRYQIVCSFLRQFSIHDIFHLESSDVVGMNNYSGGNDNNDKDDCVNGDGHNGHGDNNNDNSNNERKNDDDVSDYNLNYSILNKMHENSHDPIDICNDHSRSNTLDKNNNNHDNDYTIDDDRTNNTNNDNNNMNKDDKMHPLPLKFHHKSSFSCLILCSEKSLKFLKNISNILKSTHIKSLCFSKNENENLNDSRSSIKICEKDRILLNLLNASICIILNNILLFDDFNAQKKYNFILENNVIKELILGILNNTKLSQFKYDYKYWSRLCIFNNFNLSILDIIMIFTHKNTETKNTENKSTIPINTANIPTDDIKNTILNRNNTPNKTLNVIHTNSHLTNSPLKRKHDHNRHNQTDSLTGLSRPGPGLGPQISGPGNFINVSRSIFDNLSNENQEKNNGDDNISNNDNNDNEPYFHTNIHHNSGNYAFKNIQNNNHMNKIDATNTENRDSPPLKIPHINYDNCAYNEKNITNKFEDLNTGKTDIDIGDILEEPSVFIQRFNGDNGSDPAYSVKAGRGTSTDAKGIGCTFGRTEGGGSSFDNSRIESTYCDNEGTKDEGKGTKVGGPAFIYPTGSGSRFDHPKDSGFGDGSFHDHTDISLFEYSDPGCSVSGISDTMKAASKPDLLDRKNSVDTDLISSDSIKDSINCDRNSSSNEKNSSDILENSVDGNKNSVEVTEIGVGSNKSSGETVEKSSHEGGWSGSDCVKKWGINF